MKKVFLKKYSERAVQLFVLLLVVLICVVQFSPSALPVSVLRIVEGNLGALIMVVFGNVWFIFYSLGLYHRSWYWGRLCLYSVLIPFIVFALRLSISSALPF